MKPPVVSVVLPTYNESENIAPLIKDINSYIKLPHEIIVVDDDSPDGTSQIVNKLIKSQKTINLRLLTRKSKHGLTNSIWDGIKISRGKIIIWMDCDFSHPPRIIPILLNKIDQGYDIAVASRFITGGGFKRNLQNSSDSSFVVFLSRIMNYTIQILLGGGFKDYTSGFIAIKRDVFKDIKLAGDYGEYFIDLMTRSMLLGYKFIEVPFVNLPRLKGESKTGNNFSKLIFRGSRYILVTLNLFYIKLKYKIGLENDIKSQKSRFK